MGCGLEGDVREDGPGFQRVRNGSLRAKNYLGGLKSLCEKLSPAEKRVPQGLKPHL